MPNVHESTLLQPERPPRMVGMLLRLSVAALVACSLLAALTYLYSSTTQIVSEYRRHLNVAAYKTQLYLDQREILLRVLSATAIRVPAGLPTLAQTEQQQAFNPLPLPANGAINRHGNPWALMLTHRHMVGILRSQGRLIYVSTQRMESYALAQDTSGQRGWTPQPATIAQALNDAVQAASHPAEQVLWVLQPVNGANRLAVYAPIDRSDISHGWLGLEMPEMDPVLRLDGQLAHHYALYDSHGTRLLYSENAPDLVPPSAADVFGLSGDSLSNYAIMLSKPIGNSGLNMAYWIPLKQLWRDNAGPLWRALVLELIFVAGVLLAARHLRRHLIQPAQRQYGALVDSVVLNRQLMATAPIGLALIAAEDESLLHGNELARDWMRHDAAWHTRLATRPDGAAHHDARLDDGRLVHITAMPLSYRGHEVVLCVVSDITAQKEAEASLIRARELAEDASQAKTRFLANLSHEIRTPLYGISGTLELLAHTGLAARQRHYLDVLQRSASALSHIVNDSLDLSRIESGHMELAIQPFSLPQLADDVISAYAGRAEGKGLTLQARLSAELAEARLGDPARLRQILGNLVCNAIKFTQSGRVVLRISPAPGAQANRRVLFEVCDTGVGIAAEHIPKLCEPYFRPNTDLSQHEPGTGLGLTICHQLARLMNASLRIASQPGQGTRITLELALPDAPGDAAAPKLQLAPTPVYVTGGDPETIHHLCDWLALWGAYAIACQDPSQALQADSILVETWPRGPTPDLSEWRGHRVQLWPGNRTPPPETADTFLASPYSLLDTGQAVLRAQQYLPLSAPAALPQPAPDTAAPPSGASASLAADCARILVVDDNPINRQILLEQFELLGCAALSAASGSQALARDDLATFNVILTDVNMPGLSGYELTAQLRAQHHHGAILGMTADATPDPSAAWQQAGMNGLLLKPLSLPQLQAQLQKFLPPGGIPDTPPPA
ncbi:ATP-binding protein [Kerstersia sp.]|uniref:ATP-binding protein n=1 Tax=Kerstersia sp. TaxID=1930783 RepID=UPI003F8F2853